MRKMVIMNVLFVSFFVDCRFHQMYMVCKKARGPLLKLMEQAQSGFGLLQDEENFIRIMLHANADSRVGILVPGQNSMN